MPADLAKLRTLFAITFLLVFTAIIFAQPIRAAKYRHAEIPMEKRDAARTRTRDLFPISQSGKIGYMNSTGHLVIPCRFDWAYDFSDHLALVKIGEEFCYINEDGQAIMTLPREFTMSPGGQPGSRMPGSFSGGLASIQANEGFGFIDKNGTVVIKPKFEEVSSFAEGLAMARLKDRWGYIDKTGKLVIAPRFTRASPFSEGLAKVSVDRADDYKWGYINHLGHMVIKPAFSFARDFSEGLAAVCDMDSSKYGYIDTHGHFAISPKFENARRFSGGLAAVKVGDYYGFIDHQGAFIINPRFVFAQEFSCGRAMVQPPGPASYGFIDKAGAFRFGPRAHETIDSLSGQSNIPGFVNGLAHVKYLVDVPPSGQNHEAYIDTSGHIVWCDEKPANRTEFARAFNKCVSWLIMLFHSTGLFMGWWGIALAIAIFVSICMLIVSGNKRQ